MEYACVARFGGTCADPTVIRLEDDRYGVVCGGDTGHRDYIWMRRMAGERGWKVRIDERSEFGGHNTQFPCRFWGTEPVIELSIVSPELDAS